MTENSTKTLTIFTPTYNRAHKLKRVYESLCAQTDKDFVWLIVDDGSEDGTEELVKGFEGEKRIMIRYFARENGGKMRAHNTGVLRADTPLFVCLDSDDYFTKEATHDILTLWREKGGASLAGIIAHKGRDEENILYGGGFPIKDSSTLKGLYKSGFKGETTLCFRTELLRKYPFPEIPGEKYVPEDVVYDRIDTEAPCLILDKILTVCELVEDGLTDRAAELRKNNPTGWFIYYYQRAGSEENGLLRLKYISHYLRFRSRVAEEYRDKYRLSAGLAVLGLPGAAILAAAGKL